MFIVFHTGTLQKSPRWGVMENQSHSRQLTEAEIEVLRKIVQGERSRDRAPDGAFWRGVFNAIIITIAILGLFMIPAIALTQ